MNIAYLRIKGFRGVKGELTIKFPPGFAVIYGPNGVGKTTVCNAIEFALTGNFDKNGEATEKGEGFSDYVWWRGESPPEERSVSLGIRINSSEVFEIVRTPTGLISNDEKSIQAKLSFEKIAPQGCLKHLCKTTILKAEDINNLSVDMAESERFAFVKAALGAADFSNLETKAKGAYEHIRNEIQKLQVDYEIGRQRIGLLKVELSKAQSELVNVPDFAAAERALREALGTAAQEVSELITLANREIAKLRRQISALRRHCDFLVLMNKRRQELETPEFLGENQRLSNEVKALELDLARFKEGAKDSAELINRLRTNEGTLAATAELVQHGRQIGLVDGKCPLCNSPIAERTFSEWLNKASEMVNQKVRELAGAIDARNKLTNQIREISGRMENTGRSLRERQAVADNLNSEYGRMVQELLESGISLKEWDPTNTEACLGAARQLQQKLEQIEASTAILGTSAVVSRMEKLNRDIEIAQRGSTAIDSRIAKVKAAAEKAKHAADVIRRVTGEIVEDRLAELSPLLGELYTRLRPHVDWEEFSCLMRGDVRRLLSFQVGGLNPRFFFSSGQRRAAGLAFLLAVHLSRPWCRLETLVLDDPVQHIDDYRALHLAELLSAVQQLNRQVICTVEDAALGHLICRRMRSKQNGEGSLISLKYDPGEGVHLDKVHLMLSSVDRILTAA